MERGGEAIPDQKLLPSQRLSFWRPQGSAARNLILRPLNEGPCSHQDSRGGRHSHTWFSLWGKGPLPFSGTDIGGTTHSLLRLRKTGAGGEIFGAFLSCRERRCLNPGVQTCLEHTYHPPTYRSSGWGDQRPRWVYCNRKLGNNLSVHLQRRPN